MINYDHCIVFHTLCYFAHCWFTVNLISCITLPFAIRQTCVIYCFVYLLLAVNSCLLSTKNFMAKHISSLILKVIIYQKPSWLSHIFLSWEVASLKICRASNWGAYSQTWSGVIKLFSAWLILILMIFSRTIAQLLPEGTSTNCTRNAQCQMYGPPSSANVSYMFGTFFPKKLILHHFHDLNVRFSV